MVERDQLSVHGNTPAQRVFPATTQDMAIDTVGQTNTILLGTPLISGMRLSGVLDELNFRFDPTWNRITNRKPLKGEPTHFDDRRVAATQSMEVGIIAHLPGDAGTGNLLLFISAHTATLPAQLVSPTSAAVFEQAWRGAGSPRYFESVVEAEMDGKTPLRTRVAGLRESRIRGWQRLVTSR